jgi:hypothetical protein
MTTFNVDDIENHIIESEFELDSIFLLHHGVSLDENTYNTPIAKQMRIDIVDKKSLGNLYPEFLDYSKKRNYEFSKVYNDIYKVGEIANQYINSRINLDEFRLKCPKEIPEQPKPIDGHIYLIIDLCEATVQTLVYYGFDIGGKNWDEIANNFTDEPYLKHQKYLRNYAFVDVLMFERNRIAKTYIENMTSRILTINSNKLLHDLLADDSRQKITILDSVSIDITDMCPIDLNTKEYKDIVISIKEELGISVKLKTITYQQHQQV